MSEAEVVGIHTLRSWKTVVWLVWTVTSNLSRSDVLSVKIWGLLHLNWISCDGAWLRLSSGTRWALICRPSKDKISHCVDLGWGCGSLLEIELAFFLDAKGPNLFFITKDLTEYAEFLLGVVYILLMTYFCFDVSNSVTFKDFEINRLTLGCSDFDGDGLDKAKSWNSQRKTTLDVFEINGLRTK